MSRKLEIKNFYILRRDRVIIINEEKPMAEILWKSILRNLRKGHDSKTLKTRRNFLNIMFIIKKAI